MKSTRRANYIWLVLLGLAVAAVMLSGAASPIVSGVVAVAYLAVLAYAMASGVNWKRVRSAIPSVSFTPATVAGKKATQQARSQPGFSSDHMLTDVGLIANTRQSGNLNMRLAQIVSHDDDAIQPYARIHVPGKMGQRLALVKFEIFDHSGQIRFSHEMEQWMREGNNTILCDRQLPLRDDDSLSRSRVWDLRIMVDGALAGIHSFNVVPSTSERRRRLASDGEIVSDISRSTDEEEEARPLSLEDLLREQSKQSSRGRGA